MSKRSLLFITPSRSYGGTNSSLSSIYNLLKDDFDFTILTLTGEGNGTYEFLSKAVSLPAINAYYANFSDLNGSERILAYCVKFLKHLSILFHGDLDLAYLRRKIRRFESSRKFDCVIGFQEGQASLIASLCSNTNKIAWIHSDIERVGNPSTKELKMYSGFRNIVCVSKFTRRKFTARYPQLEGKSLAIYNLVDLTRIKRCSDEPVENELFPADTFTIVSAGRMDPVKQFSLIPGIAKQLKTNGCVFKWYILGGPENVEYHKVKHAIQDNDVSDYVFLLGNKTNPYPYFKNANLYVSTSWSEACPMVFIETQLCGIPIVTNNFGSSFEFVQDGVNGYIDTIDNLWIPIAKLVTDKETYQRIKAECGTDNIDNSAILIQLQKLFS